MTVRSLEEVVSRAESLLGTPYKPLPGNPPPHKVLGRTSSGSKLTVEVIQQIMNDAFLMDALRGVGEYRLSCADSRDQREAYELAIKLYRCEPIDLHGPGFAEAAYSRSQN